MFHTRTSQYAIRALRFLAKQNHGLSRLDEIADAEGVPPAFLAKLLQRLVKRRLVRSLKGVRGGFGLNLPADQITLYMIVDALDDLPLPGAECVFGNRQCSDENRCSLHDRWRNLKTNERRFLREVTLAQVVQAGEHMAAGDAK